MATHVARVSWDRKGATFTDGRYSRGHLWRFKTPAGLAGTEQSNWLLNGGGTLGVAFHF